MGARFKLKANSDWLKGVTEYLVEGLREYGYQVTMHLNRPDNPGIWEFQKNDTVLTMTITPIGLSEESEVVIETEREDIEEELFGAVGRGMAIMVKKLSKKMLNAVKSKKAKLALVSELTNHLEKIKQEV